MGEVCFEERGVGVVEAAPAVKPVQRVYFNKGEVIEMSSEPPSADQLRGESLLRTQSVTVGASGSDAIVACDNASDAAAVWCFLESLAGAEPTYTMSQAIDRTVDGLRLEWVGSAQRQAAETVFGEYVVYESGTCSGDASWFWHMEEYASGDYEADGCADNMTHAKAQCLADYRTRFRAELEKAVKS